MEQVKVLLENSLHYDINTKMPKFHLISWWGNCVETHSFRAFCEILPKLCGHRAFPQDFPPSKLGEFTAFYAVINSINRSRNVTKKHKFFLILLHYI